MLPVVECPRVTLALWREEDRPRFRALYSDASVIRMLPEVGDLDARFDDDQTNFRRDGCQVFAAWWEGGIVGAVGLRPFEIREPERGPDLALFAHLAPHVWGQGLFTEAGAMVLRYAFDILGAARVVASVHPDDERMLRALRRLRFAFIEDLEDDGRRWLARERPSQLPRRGYALITAVVDEEGARGLTSDERFFLESEKPHLPGSVVELEADVREPTPRTGHVRRVLARPGGAAAELYKICRDLGLNPNFTPEVIREVRGHLMTAGVFQRGLEDLTRLDFVTIDNEGSRDLDQAVFVEEDIEEEGGHHLFYALADASYYAPPQSAIFHEALKRGATYYLPGLAVPMIPPALSEGLCSLNPGAVRRALVFRISVRGDGSVRQTRVFRGRIRSRQKLTYHQVQRFYDDEASSPLSRRDFADSLRRFRALGLLRMAEARARDVVRYERSEVRVGYGDQEGMTFEIVGDARIECEKVNEQISLLCNIEGARLFLRNEREASLQPVFRNHDDPPRERIKGLRRFINRLRATHELDESWAWGDEPLADYLDRLPLEGERRRLSMALHRQAMVVNVRSEFEPLASGHFGIGAEAYARFSSPMREIVGVFTHKECLEALAARGGQDDELRDRIINRANASKSFQKKLTKRCNKLAIDHLLQRDAALPRDQRPVRRGTLMGVTSSRMYVQLDEPPIELKVYLRNAPGGPYSIDPLSSELMRPDGAVFRVGDAVDLRLDQEQPVGSGAKQLWILEPVPLE